MWTSTLCRSQKEDDKKPESKRPTPEENAVKQKEAKAKLNSLLESMSKVIIRLSKLLEIIIMNGCDCRKLKMLILLIQNSLWQLLKSNKKFPGAKTSDQKLVNINWQQQLNEGYMVNSYH